MRLLSPHVAPMTPTMRQALENLADGRHAMHGMPGGRSFSGGFGRTMLALRRRGYITAKDEITDVGRACVTPEPDPHA